MWSAWLDAFVKTQQTVLLRSVHIIVYKFNLKKLKEPPSPNISHSIYVEEVYNISRGWLHPPVCLGLAAAPPCAVFLWDPAQQSSLFLEHCRLMREEKGRDGKLLAGS